MINSLSILFQVVVVVVVVVGAKPEEEALIPDQMNWSRQLTVEHDL